MTKENLEYKILQLEEKLSLTNNELIKEKEKFKRHLKSVDKQYKEQS